MAQAGTGAIFRIAAAGDTEITAKTDGEIIEFNGGDAPDTTGRMVATGFRMIRDVSPHPNPKRALTKWQDNLLGTMEVVVTGYFVAHSTTNGPAQFINWQKDPSTAATLPFGNFGLRLTDHFGGALDLTPSGSIGYLLVDVDVQDVESPRDEASFVARFIRNGVI
jgi:hypothetical protein